MSRPPSRSVSAPICSLAGRRKKKTVTNVAQLHGEPFLVVEEAPDRRLVGLAVGVADGRKEYSGRCDLR